jgi:hypothetical protein
MRDDSALPMLLTGRVHFDSFHVSPIRENWNLVGDSYQPEPMLTFGDGWWIVGVDIFPGVYRTSDEVQYALSPLRSRAIRRERLI